MIQCKTERKCSDVAFVADITSRDFVAVQTGKNVIFSKEDAVFKAFNDFVNAVYIKFIIFITVAVQEATELTSCSLARSLS